MLELYILNTCPYCKKILDFLNQNNIDVILHDITNDNELKNLKMIGGKEQVPFIYDPKNKIGMYESDNIINYLIKSNCIKKEP